MKVKSMVFMVLPLIHITNLDGLYFLNHANYGFLVFYFLVLSFTNSSSKSIPCFFLLEISVLKSIST